MRMMLEPDKGVRTGLSIDPSSDMAREVVVGGEGAGDTKHKRNRVNIESPGSSRIP